MTHTVTKLVRGDTGPQIKITVTNESTGAVIDLTGATALMYFREYGTATILDTIAGVLIPPTVNGEVAFNWGATTLDVPGSDYEGEVQITFPSGMIQTIFVPLYFSLREEFS